MLKLYLATTLICMLGFFNSIAQIQLKIVDPDEVVIPYANTQLIPSSGEDLFIGAASDTNGLVVYNNVKVGTYFMVIRYLGFTTDTINNIIVQVNNEAIDLGELVLQPSSIVLQEFGVKAQRPKIIYENNGDFSFSPGSTTMGMNEDASKLLETIPGVGYNSQKGYMINGNNNIVILVDGRRMSGDRETIESYLESFSSDNVQEVKIIKSSTAKYDASASGGVINIITKKSSYAGINGFIYSRYRQGRFSSYRGRYNLNWKYKKFSGNVFYEYFMAQSFHDIEISRSIQKAQNEFAYYNESVYESWLYQAHLPKISLNYDINDNNRIGIMLEIRHLSINQPLANLASASDNPLTADSLINTAIQINNRDIWPAVNFNYATNIKGKGNLIDFTYDFFYKDISKISTYKKDIYDPSGLDLWGTSRFIRDNKFMQPVHTASIDFARQLPRDISLDIGTRFTLLDKRNDGYFKNYVGDEFVTVPSLSRSFDYTERIMAGYINWNKKFNGWSLTMGLRVENTFIDQFYVSEDSLVNSKYTDVFPSINFYKELGKDINFRLGYTRGLRRPIFNELDPARIDIGPFIVTSGNPTLRPQIDNLITLEFTFKRKYALYFNYNAANFSVNQIFKEEPGDVYNITYANFDRSHLFNAGGNIGTDINEWWTISADVNFYFDKFRITIDDNLIETKGAATAFTINSQFIMPKSFFLDLNGTYESPRYYAIEQFKSTGFIDVALTKNFFDDKLSIKLQASDILRTKRAATSQNFFNLNNTYLEFSDSRKFELLVNYRFRRGENFRAKQNKRSNQDELIRS
ncbi:MAG: TonB-dependent receptor [Chitinophagales bacterium]